MNLCTLALAVLAASSDTTRTPAPGPRPAMMPAARPARAAAASADTLDLAALEREALLRNPSLAAMRAAAASARAEARVAGSLEDPMISIAAAPRSYTEPGTGMAGQMTPAEDRFPAWRASIRQRLPLFGARGLERASARAEASAATLDAEATRLDLLERVRLAFFDLYRIDRAIETNEQQTDLVGQFRRVALTRYAAGTEGQQDPLQADSELGMLAHARASLERERRTVAAELNTLLHREAAAPVGPAPRRLVVPVADTAGAARGAWPEVRAAEARVAASASRRSA